MIQKPPRKPRGKVKYSKGKCISCGEVCVAECPTHAIEMMESGEPIIHLEKCNGCRKCIKVCPSAAFEVFYTPDEEKILAEYNRLNLGKDAHPPDPGKTRESEWKGVWVFVEQMNGVAHSVSWELLGVGRQLAQDLGVELSAFILGSHVSHLVNEAFGYGADNVYITDEPILEHYRTQSYLKASINLLKKYKPEIVLMGATGLGRDLAGAVATHMKTGLTADCTGLTISKSDRLLEQTRPAFGGNIMATILSETARPQMASVRPKVMSKPDFVLGKNGNLFQEPFMQSEDSIMTKILEIIPIDLANTVQLQSADIIVSGGRGMMGPENFDKIRELAELLGGVVGCSRATVDAGWMPQLHQVGQTGKTVKPKLYIACGISGAIQHLVGMQSSDNIIAINKDKNAPIFEVAHLGIVGDVFDVLPGVIQRLKECKQVAAVETAV